MDSASSSGSGTPTTPSGSQTRSNYNSLYFSPPNSPATTHKTSWVGSRVARTTTDKLGATHISNRRVSLVQQVERKLAQTRKKIADNTHEVQRLEKELDQLTGDKPVSFVCAVM